MVNNSQIDIDEINLIELIKTVHYPDINLNQGLAWYYKNQNDRILFGHNGGDIGSLTEMFVSFSDSIGVVLLTNSSNYWPLIEIENAVLSFAEENNFIESGDINSDSNINIQDVVLVVNLILNSEYDYLADLNLDNIVDVLDIVQLVNLILN